MAKILNFLKNFWPEIIFLVAAFCLSWWLMWQSFSYDKINNEILVSSKVWGDFASHLPLVRSFSLGANFPPEFPLFSGKPIRYHFLFYALVGSLEKIGLRLDWALNLPSLLSFFLLLLSIYFLAKYLFQKRSVAFLSAVFFLFNGSFSFLEFIMKHPLNNSFIKTVLKNDAFPSVFPFEKSPFSIADIFWNLNVFTNQRHLSLSLALILFVLLIILHDSKNNFLRLPHYFLFGLVLGILPLWNGPAFIMAAAVFGTYLVLNLKSQFSKILVLLTSMCLVALPQVLAIRSGNLQSSISFYPGYLIHDQLDIVSFVKFWFFNLGLGFFLIPLGFLLSKRENKKVFLSFLPLFVIGNLFRFSPDPGTNHKFFNLFVIVANMASAHAIVRIFYFLRRFSLLLATYCLLPVVFFLTLSGLLDFFPIKNDFYYRIGDAPKNPDVAWIKNNTPPQSVFLNTSYFYHPANLAGRKIFYGWPYYTWSAGYDTDQRKAILRSLFTNQDKTVVCRLLKDNQLDYVALEKQISFLEIQEAKVDFWQNNFLPIYQNLKTGLTIYQVSTNCR